MTRKRRYLISAVVLVSLVGVALGVLAILPPRPGVTKANYDRIEEGMTRAKVEELFGKGAFSLQLRSQEVGWTADDGAIAFVEFDDGKVFDKRWHESEETFTDKLRRWLHLPPE